VLTTCAFSPRVISGQLGRTDRKELILEEKLVVVGGGGGTL